MAADLYDARFQSPALDNEWAPSERLRTWLAVGLGGLAINLVLVLIGALLERKHWGQDGLTPDMIVGYLAILPAALALLVYLRLAREAHDRGLWKSAAGVLAAYVIASAIGLALEDLPRRWTIVCNLFAAAGLLSLLVFSLSKRPKFADSHPSAVQLSGAESDAETRQTLPSEAAAGETAAGETAATAESSEEGGSGCLVHIGIGLGIFAFKMFLRRANGRFPNVNLGLDEWALLLGAILLVFGLCYATWFAVAKIRLWHKLGGLAAAVGSAELLILLVHAGMFVALLGMLVTAIANNPQLDDGDLDKLLDPWLLQASLVTTISHSVWIVLTAALFTSLWLRPQADWRESFLAPK